MKVEKITGKELETVKAELRADMPKGSTVYTILRSVSRSGMSRVISPVVLTIKDKKIRPIFPEYHVAQVLEYSSLSDHPEGIKVGGCGMDMGFSLVYNLASALYGDGYALKQEWL
jgi:hypothetical protein